MTKDAHQPDYVIKKKRPASWYWLVAMAFLLLIVSAMALGYWLNQRQHTFSETVQAQFDELEKRLETVQSEVVQWQQQYQVEHAITVQQQQDYKKLQSQYANLLKERTALQRIFDPKSVSEGLQIASFTLEPLGTESYDYRLILIQAKKHDKVLKGSLEVTIVGETNGEAAQYEFSKIGALDAKNAQFSFKYSKTAQGRFSIPEGFEPHYIRVTASVTGRNSQSITQDYPWEFGIE